MTSEEIDLLCDVMVEKQYSPGDTIIREGDDGDNFYILSQGSAPITIEGKGQVYESQPGDFFGELALLYDAPRSATVKAGGSGASCWALDRISFKALIYKGTMEKRKKHDSFLRGVKVLNALTEYERGRMADALCEREVLPGVVIVKEGDPGEDFFLVESGEFKVTKEGYDGEVCDRLTHGSYFGELALLHSQPRAATVEATKAGRVLYIHRETFTALLGNLREILTRNEELYVEYSAKEALAAETETDTQKRKKKK